MNEESLAFRAARGVGWVFAWRMVTRVLGLASTLVLVRYLQPGDFGLVAIAVAVAAAVDSLSSFNTEYALIREKSTDRPLYDTAFTLNFLRGIFSAALMVIAAWPLARFLGDERLAGLIVALSSGLALTSLENIGIVEFRRDFAFDKEFQLFVLPRLLAVVSNIVLAVLWPSYWVLVIGSLLTRVSRLILTYVIHPYRPRFTLRAWRPLFAYSVWVWFDGIVATLRERADPMVLGRMLDTARVGVFTIGMEIALLASTEIMQPISRVLFPGFAAARHGGSDIAEIYGRAMAVTAMIVFPVCLGTSLLAEPIVIVALGPQWVEAVAVVRWISLVNIAIAIGFAGYNLLGVLGRTRWQFQLSLISICMRLPLLIGFTWAGGLTGAALGLTIASTIDCVLNVVVVGRHLRLRPRDFAGWLWRPSLASAAMALCLYFTGLGWQPMDPAIGRWDAIGHAALTAAIGAAIYIGTLGLAWLSAGRPAGAERFLLNLAVAATAR